MAVFEQIIYIADKQISTQSPVFIIAEAGVNHNGDIHLAEKLIDVAVSAGVDAVKFQSFKTDHLILQGIVKADYQIENTGQTETQTEMLEKLEMGLDQMRHLKTYCDAKGILFMTTPFDEYSLHLLDELDLAAYKISSTDTTNLPFLKKVAEKGKPIILSTGMSYMHEVESAVETIRPFNRRLILLQCTSNYPTPDDEVNLRVIDMYRSRFDMLVGFSDHTVGIGASPYAVSMGAVVIEKHFTLDKTMDGPDHSASLDPEELKAFVSEIRRVEAMRGSEEKAPTSSEQSSRRSLQKCLVATQPISSGEEFTAENIIGMRTNGVGIAVFEFDKIVGTKADRDYARHEVIVPK